MVRRKSCPGEVSRQAVRRRQRPLVACLAAVDAHKVRQASYEGLLAAQECLPDNGARDAFAADYNA